MVKVEIKRKIKIYFEMYVNESEIYQNLWKRKKFSYEISILNNQLTTTVIE